ncbi:MAG: DNA alkylation repair protein [Mucilaginibacter sp.]
MTVPEVMAELQGYGSDSVKKIWLKHGIKEPFFGVKIKDLKKIQKKVKTDNELAKGLFATGNADAMYLAGLITDDKKMTKADLNAWAKQALSSNISEYTVPWVAAGNNDGYELALEWIDSTDEHVAAAGWATLGGWMATHADSELDLSALQQLMQRVLNTIKSSPDRVRYQMNNFMIHAGTYVIALTDEAIAIAKQMGKITVIKEGTECKTPDAIEYILKAKSKGTLGKKKTTMKC